MIFNNKEKSAQVSKVFEMVGNQLKKEFEDLQENGVKVAEIKAVRDGDVVKIYVTSGLRAETKIMNIQEMILQFEEKLVLEKMTKKEFLRFKDVVDSEWMRRKFNGNSN